jgi:hypothetical protein
MRNIELPSPTSLSAAQRAAEITRILAAAIVRTHGSQTGKQRAVDLGSLPDQRVHTTPYP